jgi:hypothetical protein
MGDCILRAAILKNDRISPHFVVILTKKWVGLNFARFFHKPIWSTWWGLGNRCPKLLEYYDISCRLRHDMFRQMRHVRFSVVIYIQVKWKEKGNKAIIPLTTTTTRLSSYRGIDIFRTWISLWTGYIQSLQLCTFRPKHRLLLTYFIVKSRKQAM